MKWALLGVLRSPFFCLLDETIFWLCAAGRWGFRAGLFAAQFPPEFWANRRPCAKFAAETLKRTSGR